MSREREIPRKKLLKRRQQPEVRRQSEQEIKPYNSEDLVRSYQFISDVLQTKIGSIYYPSSSYDISPSVAFPSSNVTYADIDTQAVTALQKAGVDALEVDARTFVTEEPVDAAILLNPVIHPEGPMQSVKPGGLIISNNYHKTADTLRENPEVVLVGVVHLAEDGERLLDTHNLNDYFAEVETDDEFKRAPFSWSGVDYHTGLSQLQRMGMETKNVVAEYKQLLSTARKEREQESETFRKEHPELDDAEDFDEDDDVLLFNYNGQQLILPTGLPKKKGTADSIFVFKKNGGELIPDQRPPWLQQSETGKGVVSLGQEKYVYTIVDKNLEPRLPGFVGFPRAEYLFISEEVPQSYRSHVLSHEIREMTLLQGKKGRCLSSLQAELAGVPEQLRSAYIPYRRDFFTHLVDYYKDSPDEDFKAEIQASLNYLSKQ